MGSGTRRVGQAIGSDGGMNPFGQCQGATRVDASVNGNGMSQAGTDQAEQVLNHVLVEGRWVTQDAEGTLDGRNQTNGQAGTEQARCPQVCNQCFGRIENGHDVLAGKWHAQHGVCERDVGWSTVERRGQVALENAQLGDGSVPCGETHGQCQAKGQTGYDATRCWLDQD
jgi:hypothetical protein